MSGTAWLDAAARLDEPLLRTVVVGQQGALDGYFAWHRLREIDESGALLVRPDGVVAWRHARAQADPASALAHLRAALRTVLSRPAG